MSHSLELLDGAFIISDAHYSHKRPEFLEFLKDIYSKKLKPSQIIFMGDIFDALFGGIPYTLKENEEAVQLINTISLDIEVIYLEGNHDFNLKNIFTSSKVFSLKQQPISMKYKDKKILLAHGDIESDFGYKLYSSFIRNPLILFILNFIDNLLSNLIIKKLDIYLSKKEDCNEFIGLEKFIKQRLHGKYSCDYFIEGHFHQNTTLHLEEFIYINLGVFACNQRYFIVNFSKELELLQEKIFSEGK